MIKTLVTAACAVALVGCSKNDPGSVGGPASGDYGGGDSEIRHDPAPSVTNNIPRLDSPGSSATNTWSSTNSLPQRSSTNSAGATNSSSTFENYTGDRSNGDLSNRPAGSPGRSESGEESSGQEENSIPNQSEPDSNSPKR